MTLVIDIPTMGDAIELAETIRDADREEILRSSGRQPFEAILDGMVRSAEVHVARYHGRVMAIWGVGVDGTDTILGPRTGIVWMLTSELVSLHPKTFWRACKVLVPELFKRWDVLLNVIDERHECAIRWAKRLGFVVEDEPVAWGPERSPFRLFSVTREVLNV